MVPWKPSRYKGWGERVVASFANVAIHLISYVTMLPQMLPYATYVTNYIIIEDLRTVVGVEDFCGFFVDLL